MLSSINGPIIYWIKNEQKAVFKLERESADFILGGDTGSIRIKPLTVRAPRVFVYNSNFTNVFAKDGSVMSVSEIGKLYMHTCNFNQTVNF